MANITEAQALGIVSLETMKAELRIPLAETAHDALLTRQITDAVVFVAQATGATGDGLLPLRAAAVAVVRALYDGQSEISRNASHSALLAPFRSYEAG